ncbi:hypothetical protein [Deinococcus roseus]|uniref:Uncharacterized protein n=1 Tax=Deinococcus roseus TaxID=392414 RepID=A0ABQ2CZV7_9DEIO|nr:hypothetical protein [Deinococcus roseus]GGJ37106.1 hypothetical protein GCM10008938_23990 [Deinococcus roseus]
MKNHLHPLTHYGHNIKMGVRVLQWLLVGLGVLLVLQVHQDPVQLLGVLCAVVLLLLIAETSRRWTASSEMYVLRMSSALHLQKLSLSLRWGLISLLVLQTCWWLLNALHLTDQLAWGAFFGLPLPQGWNMLQQVGGLLALLLWVALERWTHALQTRLQGQDNIQTLQKAYGAVNLLVLLLQGQHLLQLLLLPFNAVPTHWMGYAQLTLHGLHAILLICFLGWVRGYLQHLTALNTLRTRQLAA